MNTDNMTDPTPESNTDVNKKKRYVPPYPKPLESTPSLINRFWLIYKKSWLSTFHKKSYTMKMGHVKTPTSQTFTVNQPDLVKKVLTSSVSLYPKSRRLYQMLTPLVGDGIFISNGELWKSQRAMMNKALSASHIRQVYPLMVDALEHTLEQMDKYVELDDTINMSQMMAHLTADIIFRTIFSKPLSKSDSDAIFHAFAEYQKRISTFQSFIYLGIPTSLVKVFTVKQANIIRGVIQKNIEHRIAQIDRGDQIEYEDILAFMLKATHPETGEKFSKKELVDQIAVLFLAGHETSATTLSWCFYILANQPELQDEIAKEAIAIQASKSFEFTDIRKLKKASNAFKETLRLYPPVGGFMREATQQECMRDKVIKPQDTVYVIPWLLHRREDIWPHAHEFDPERFGCPHHKEAIRDTYYPYGAGPRVCIGASFANQEAVMTVAALTRRYYFEPVDKCEPNPVGYLTIKPDQDIILKVRSRY